MGQILELGAFSTDITQVVRQLREDLKDDWFPDSLGYEDALKPDVVVPLLEAVFNRNHGRFIPDKRDILDIPKQNGGLRYSLEMSLQDRLYYQAMVGYLIPFYDPLLPNQILSHRHARSDRRANRYLFKHPIEQWTRFNNYVAQEARSKQVILVTDLQNYFENINLELLFHLLRECVESIDAPWLEKAKIRSVLRELENCLPSWCFAESHGLPQNRDASSFLANLAMLPIDRAMLSRGFTYYRYMDDIRVVASTVREAEEALRYLIVQLRQQRFSINFGKNKILSPGEGGYEEIAGRSSPLLAEIYNMWRSRSIHVIRRSFPPLQRLLEDLIKSNATQDRTFRFCINKFRNIALCPELEPPKTFFGSLIDVCIDELPRQPFSSDQLVKFLKAAPTSADHMARVAALLSDTDRSVCDWQNYLLWGLLVYKRYASPQLLSLAKTRVFSTAGPAERSGAVLYLGALGTLEERQFLSQEFRTFGEHLSQRNALIAIHEVGFNEGIKQNVKEHVLPSLRGTYQRLREGYLGQYFRPLPRVQFIDICDEVSSYD